MRTNHDVPTENLNSLVIQRLLPCLICLAWPSLRWTLLSVSLAHPSLILGALLASSMFAVRTSIL
ncbi:hypothetical protein M405DRAFT_828052 [Rhizopogon salebrosus TDB-379]|nr:hypothetical protein M405DRAFT_828052 [Rhizopogon salebrosus TDB-379]